MNITVKKEHTSLPVGLTWDNIPNFAVLTGKNGCGKTHLLRYIKYVLTQKDAPYEDNEICLIHESLKLEYTSSSNHVSSPTPFLQELINSLRQHQTKDAYKDKHSDFLIKIANSTGNTLEELDEYDLFYLVAETINHGEQLKKILAMYEISKRKKANSIFDNPTSEPIKKNKSPCELINELLDKYNSDFSIEIPKFSTNINLEKLDFNVDFINKKTGFRARFVQLSTGEQSLIQMIIAIYNPNGIKSTKLLLLDEIDRHLHPSSCQTLIKIIRDIFVKEYGIKVILTTHCLATIALCHDEDLFLMEKNTTEIRNITKKDAMQAISDNVLSFEDGIKIVNKISQSTVSTILLVEGKHDESHIMIAKEKLKINYAVEIISLNGVQNLRSFISSVPQIVFEGKTVIGIFDLDEAGIKEFNNFGDVIQGTSQIRKSSNLSNLYAITIPPYDPMFETYKNMPIEYLYDKSILNSVGMNLKKIDFRCAVNKYGYLQDQDSFDADDNLWLYILNDDNGKTRLTQEIEGLDPSAFRNFLPLFKQVEEIIKLN